MNYEKANMEIIYFEGDDVTALSNGGSGYGTEIDTGNNSGWGT